MFRNLLQDLRGGARVLLKRPAFTAVAVLSLGLGIGANTAIFTIINAVFLNPLPVEKPSRVVEVFTRDTRTVDTSANFALTPSSLPNYEDYRDRNGVFSGLAAQSFPIAVNWSGNAEPEQVNVVLASANYFDVLGVRPAAGRTFLSGEDKKVGGDTLAVLSYSLWTRRFGGNRNVLGQTLRLNGDAYTVIGVAPPNFKGTFTLAGPDVIWVPVSMRTRVLTGFALQYADNRRFRWLGMVGRLKDGVQLEQASSSLKIIASALEKTYPNENRGRTVELKRLSDTALGVNQQQVLQLAGGVMMAVVGLVLLIACVNLANLLMAQAAEREKEITIRAAMGASRGRLVR
ncbi:MAG TPA: ABC transporter permease, partial [Methylomirabilota bacterium]|nr:ABC transporter permease [Methylomirabilota bacterium]